MATALTADAPVTSPSRAQWVRKYPPLLAVLAALLIAVFVLPSALHVPQSNPQTTLEYAPVPPSDEKTPPANNGNLSSLGLAGSSSFTGAVPGGDEGLGVDNSSLGGNKKDTFTKHCVGNPPRQTEDPLSPPCVADFRGDNFGATYQGVTADQVTVLFYVQGFTDYTNTCRDAAQVTPDRKYFDLDQPPQPGEHCEVRVLRNWQTYFNDRFETYKRHVHFWAYFSGSGNSAEERRADAADNYARLKPFAVMTVADGQTYGDDYLEVMAQRNVLNFGSFLGRDEAFFNTYPKLIWGYQPSIEHQADLFSTYVCTKMKGNPVETNFTNMPQDVGKPRVYGFWHTDDAGHPELIKLAASVKSSLQKCGITFKADNTFPEAGFAKSAHYAPTKAQTAAADFRSAGVTTIIWPGGLETNFSAAAANVGYRPEILVLGDQVIETETNGGFQDQSVWDHSRLVSNVPYVSDERTQLCYTAYKEVEPDADDGEVRADVCPLYAQIRQLFTGIQVAGPRLGPTSVDKGFHAVPRVASTNPTVPACFYDVNDYTCVKDAKVEHWDQTGRTSTAQQTPGCYRGTEAAKRYLTGTWPQGNATAQDTPNDPCDAYDGGYLINPNPPSTSNPGG